MESAKLVNCCVLLLVLNVAGLQKPFSPRYTRLQRYNVDPRTVSVSGISNGGGFAAYMAFIYSSLIRGVGIFAGAPYPVAYMVYASELTNLLKIDKYYRHIDRFSDTGAIDPIQNMRGVKVFVYQGSKDILVPKFYNYDVVREFKHYGAVVKTELQTVPAGHCFPTDNYGDYLPQFGSFQAICKAGFQGANHMFHHLYGSSFNWPISNNGTPTGQLFKYDQNEFFKGDFAEGAGLNGAAFIYVPRACQWHKVKCRLHLAFHGSTQQLFYRIFADGHSEFVQNAGYLQAADANNIIILFPESKPLNFASWDIWGYTGRDFVFKNGTQPLGIARMIQRVLYGT